jgi:Ca2+-binding RTX toxin-like protein
MTRSTRSLLLLAAAVAATVLTPAPASAAVTFGADLSRDPNSGTFAANVSVPQQGPFSNPVHNGSPISGVLVAARIRHVAAGASGKFLVLRPTGNPHESDQFTNVGEASVSVPASAAVPTEGTKTTEFPTRLPIQGGDHLGFQLETTNPPASEIRYVYSHPETLRWRLDGAHPPNTTATYTDTTGEPLIQGTVEADADGDGYGDESQDRCPTDASTQGECPPPPPSLLSGACANESLGTAGPDVLTGTSAGDRLVGLGGDDLLSGLQGVDCLFGNSGDDRLSGGSEGDRVTGGSGDDRLTGGAGTDRLSGGSGNDILRGGPGRDRITCGSGRDRVRGGRRDRLIGC